MKDFPSRPQTRSSVLTHLQGLSRNRLLLKAPGIKKALEPEPLAWHPFSISTLPTLDDPRPGGGGWRARRAPIPPCSVWPVPGHSARQGLSACAWACGLAPGSAHQQAAGGWDRGHGLAGGGRRGRGRGLSHTRPGQRRGEPGETRRSALSHAA